MSRVEEILQAVQAEVPRQVDHWETPDGRGRCLMASRIGYETLRHFGVEVEPIVTVAAAVNAAWLAWMEAGGEPPMPDEAWSVAIDPRRGAGGFNGHLVLRVAGDQLLDLDAREMARPQHGIFVPDTVLIPFNEDGRAGLELSSSGLLLYEPHQDPPRFATVGGWRKFGKEAGPVIRRVRERLEVAHA